jgi:hypothetical protein
LKRLIRVVAAVLLLTCHEGRPAFAQAADRAARLLDEYGDVNYEDELARLDNFANELQAEPSSQAHIVVYRGRRDLPGLIHRRGLRARHYLIDQRGIDPGHVVIVEGGVTTCLSVELWLVPPGAGSPPLKWTYAYSLTDITVTFKFDEHGYSLPHDVDAYDEEGARARGVAPELLAGYAAALKAKPDARAFVIAYEQYCRDCLFEGEGRRPKVLRDPRGTAERMLKDEKALLVNQYGLGPSRIVTVHGGHRRHRGIDLWIVPKGADAPVPSPSVIPPRGRRR